MAHFSQRMVNKVSHTAGEVSHTAGAVSHTVGESYPHTAGESYSHTAGGGYPHTVGRGYPHGGGSTTRVCTLPTTRVCTLPTTRVCTLPYHPGYTTARHCRPVRHCWVCTTLRRSEQRPGLNPEINNEDRAHRGLQPPKDVKVSRRLCAELLSSSR